MCLFNGTSKVKRCQQSKNKGLDYTHERPERQDSGRDDPGGEPAQNEQNYMFCGHIAKEPDSQGDRADQMADTFNNEHQHHKGQGHYGTHRAEEMFEVPDSMRPYAEYVGRKKDRYGHGSVIVDITRRGIKAGYQAHKVADCDIEGYRGDEGKERGRPVMADIFFSKIEYAFGYSFHKILDAGRDKFQGTPYKQTHNDQDDRR